jgi:hypothetical protein
MEHLRLGSKYWKLLYAFFFCEQTVQQIYSLNIIELILHRMTHSLIFIVYIFLPKQFINFPQVIYIAYIYFI